MQYVHAFHRRCIDAGQVLDAVESLMQDVHRGSSRNVASFDGVSSWLCLTVTVQGRPVRQCNRVKSEYTSITG